MDFKYHEMDKAISKTLIREEQERIIEKLDEMKDIMESQKLINSITPWNLGDLDFLCTITNDLNEILKKLNPE